METTLHRQLKTLYGGQESRFEVPVGRYRVDVATADWLVEIQHGSLAAIRHKVQELLEDHQVVVVKPIVVRRLLVKRRSRGGPVVGRRMSPKRGRLLDLFDDLVYFIRVFPHRRLRLDVPLVDIEEWRYPGHGRRRRWRARDQVTEDQKLIRVHCVHRFQTAADVGRLIPRGLPEPFHTGHLAECLSVERWVAQRIAYCLRKIGAVQTAGKKGNAWLYQFA
ncbi:MAG TPA: hypothetical protein EYH34_11490 [Planctomycetes bacterium]|nr:hypothetical protein [Planctomycetota bacterium]